MALGLLGRLQAWLAEALQDIQLATLGSASNFTAVQLETWCHSWSWNTGVTLDHTLHLVNKEGAVHIQAAKCSKSSRDLGV